MEEKRTVYDLFMMLGDVGGLSDILTVVTATLVGFFNEPLMLASFITKLYRAVPKSVKITQQ